MSKAPAHRLAAAGIAGAGAAARCFRKLQMKNVRAAIKPATNKNDVAMLFSEAAR